MIYREIPLEVLQACKDSNIPKSEPYIRPMNENACKIDNQAINYIKTSLEKDIETLNKLKNKQL